MVIRLVPLGWASTRTGISMTAMSINLRNTVPR
jgi:hypothetical protein